jgi:hypothetical protein
LIWEAADAARCPRERGRAGGGSGFLEARGAGTMLRHAVPDSAVAIEARVVVLPRGGMDAGGLG